MIQPLFLVGAAVFAVLLGLVIGWFAGRGRTAALTANAAAAAKASMLGELATLNERSDTLLSGWLQKNKSGSRYSKAPTPTERS